MKEEDQSNISPIISVEEVTYQLYDRFIRTDWFKWIEGSTIILTPDTTTAKVIAQSLGAFKLGREQQSVKLIDCTEPLNDQLVEVKDNQNNAIFTRGLDSNKNNIEIFYNIELATQEKQNRIGRILENKFEATRILVCTNDLYSESSWGMYLDRKRGPIFRVESTFNSIEELIKMLKQCMMSRFVKWKGFITFGDVVKEGYFFKTATEVYEAIFIPKKRIVNGVFDDCTGVIICENRDTILNFKTKRNISKLDIYPLVDNEFEDYRLYLVFERGVNNCLTFIGAHSGFMLNGRIATRPDFEGYKPYLRYYWFKSPWVELLDSSNAYLRNDCYFNGMEDGVVGKNSGSLDSLSLDKLKEKTSKPLFATSQSVLKVEESYLHCNLTPDNICGNVHTSNLYLLNMNPGYEEEDMQLDTTSRKRFADEFRKVFSLDAEAVFAWLLKDLNGNGLFKLNSGKEHPGHTWWFKKEKQLDALIASHNGDYIRDLFVCEYFPYHTHSGIIDELKKHSALPSYDFTDQIIWRALYFGKNIIIMRCRNEWKLRIPALLNTQGLNNIYILQNPQGCHLTINNIVHQNPITLIETSKLC